MTTLTKFVRAVDAYAVVGIFSLICAIVGVLGSQQQADQASNERWAKDGGTKYASRQ
ncbi:hypothetical protein [Achromobacter spanius]|uniref:hypothetical protein n=1 Tax=Achromobacter spanius TaxID=217203 RepID=UPI0013DF9D9B|nr:hypothetical protein [Achromobacter spanius]